MSDCAGGLKAKLQSTLTARDIVVIARPPIGAFCRLHMRGTSPPHAAVGEKMKCDAVPISFLYFLMVLCYCRPNAITGKSGLASLGIR